MTAPSSLSLIFEASISAQMILFACAQAAGVPKVGPLRAVLAAITGSLGLAVALNALSAIGLATSLRDLNLLLELGCAAAIYLYVAHAHAAAAPFERRDFLHALPAFLAFIAWKTGIMRDMDGVVLAILATYAAATASTAWTRRSDYRPRQLRWFVMLLAASFAALVALRGAITYEAQLGVAFRDSGAYLALLLTMLALSSSALLIELRFPNLLSAPAKYLKYAASELSNADLQAMDMRLQSLMREQKPFLDPEVGLAEVAAKLGVSERTLSQLANARYGMNFPSLLNEWRIEEAARQLRDPSSAKPITTIMYDAGFGSKSAFQREFQKKFAMTPTAYRAQQRAGKAEP